MSEGERTLKILPFSGKAEDWDMWSTQFLARAGRKGYDGVLLGTTAVPDEGTTLTSTQTAEAEAKKANMDAYTDLVLCLKDKITFSLVKGAKTTKLPKGDAHLAWERLKARCVPQTGANLAALIRKFRNNRLVGESLDPEE